MDISDDRWTCPKCDRTFIIRDSSRKTESRLALFQAAHAVEHLDGPRKGQGRHGAVIRTEPLGRRR
jgi:transposase-like protein